MLQNDDRIKWAKESLEVEARSFGLQYYTYMGIEINEDNFSFSDLLNMLIVTNERLKRQIEDWKFCAELYKTT